MEEKKGKTVTQGKAKAVNWQTPEQVVMDTLVERFGQQKVDMWKRQFAPRHVGVISVEDKVAILKPITSNEIGQWTMLLADAENGGFAVAARYVLDALWIDGDTCVLDDDEYFSSAMVQVQNLMEVKKSLFTRL